MLIANLRSELATAKHDLAISIQAKRSAMPDDVKSHGSNASQRVSEAAKQIIIDMAAKHKVELSDLSLIHI